MRRINALIAAALLAATARAAGADAPAETPDALVADAMEAPSHVSYAGTVEVTKIGMRGSVATVFDIEHRAPDHTRRTFSAPADVGGDSVVVIGHRCYAIDVKRSRVVASENEAADDPTAIAANYLLMRRNYHAVATAGDAYDGRPSTVITLLSDYTNRAVVVIRIDRSTKVVLDKQQFAEDGSLVDEMRFVRVNFAPAISDADFAIPSGLTQVEGPHRAVPSEAIAGLIAGAGFAARAPKFLPLGFAPVEGSLEKIQGVRTLHLLYSDGVRTLSLFENATAPAADLSRYNVEKTSIGTRDAQYGHAGPTTLLTWSSADVNYALVGTMDLTALQKIAASI